MNPIYHQAKFMLSAPNVRLAPNDVGQEVAFAGRSNAGKSSAINTLTQQKALARISKTPGRTQLLNFFALTEELRLVDLPGYGFAKVPDAVKKDWHAMMEKYLIERHSLCGIVLVMDIRHPLTDFDWQMLEWCQARQRPVHILLTKADKLNYGQAKNTLLSVKQEVLALSSDISVQMFSALKKLGIDEAHAAIDRLFVQNAVQNSGELAGGDHSLIHDHTL